VVDADGLADRLNWKERVSRMLRAVADLESELEALNYADPNDHNQIDAVIARINRAERKIEELLADGRDSQKG